MRCTGWGKREFRAQGKNWQAGADTGSLGNLYASLGDDALSERCYREPVASARKFLDLSEEQRVMTAWRGCWCGRTVWRMPRRQPRWALERSKRVRYSSFPPAMYLVLSDIAARRDRRQEARGWLDHSLTAARELSLYSEEVQSLIRLEEWESSAGRMAEALQFGRQAVQTAQTRGLVWPLADAYHALGRLELKVGEPAAALEVSERGRARAFLELLPSARGRDGARALDQEQLRAFTRQWPGTVLVYVLGEPHSTAWLLDGGEVRMARLAGRGSIERMVRRYRQMLPEPPQEAGADYRKVSRELYRALVAPLEDGLKAGRTLAIVPDGILHYLPFETLAGAGGRVLVNDHAITYVPSVPVLASLSRVAGGDAGRRELLAYGDPRFTAGRAHEGNVRALYRAAGYRFFPLPATRQEALAIGSYFPPPMRTLLVGTAATEQSVKAEFVPAAALCHARGAGRAGSGAERNRTVTGGDGPRGRNPARQRGDGSEVGLRLGRAVRMPDRVGPGSRRRRDCGFDQVFLPRRSKACGGFSLGRQRPIDPAADEGVLPPPERGQPAG